MDELRRRFWAKLERADGQITAWHPVVDHCADVAACCEALLARTLLRRRLATLGGRADLSTGQVARLGVLAALHDLGKLNLGFQNKARLEARFTSGHLTEALGVLFCRRHYACIDRVWDVLPGEELVGWGEEEGLCQLLVATISHHGRPVAVPAQLDERAWTASAELDPFAGLAELVTSCRAWFPDAWRKGIEALPTNPAFQHAWSGLVTLADWLGSDARRFPLSNGQGGDRMPFARERARQVVEEIGLDADLLRPELGAAAPGYERIADGFEPRPAQAQMLEIESPAEGSATLLEAETGSGKTEAALLHFLRLYQRGQVDGLYFALPTRAAASQIYRRVWEAVAHAFPDPGRRPPVVLAVPGYLVVDAVEGELLPGFEVLWPDDERERVRWRGWAGEHPKRFLAGAVVVGTIDQVLLSALQVSHAHLRSTALLRQLLVVDEVHASDAYMTRTLESVLDQHLVAGGHALLMSATLGAAARARLLAAPGHRSEATIPSPAEARATPYPVIAVTAPGRAVELLAVAGETAEKRVRFEVAAVIDDPRAIARRALEAARRGAHVLVIRNTVKGCLEVQAALEAEATGGGGEVACEEVLFRCAGLAAPHHSRFARADRKGLDEAVELAFGKGRPSEGRVLVATQTVEQSLDLDADLLVTDLCPIDVLLQRVGRLQRHALNRPAGFRPATAVVLAPAESLAAAIGADGKARGRHGLGSVYEDLRVLEASRRAILDRPDVVIPADNRSLVEAGTHPAALAELVEALGEPWGRHQEHVLGTRLGERRHADFNLVRRDLPFDLDAGRVCFPGGDGRRHIPTRLGEEDRLVRFGDPPQSPFGHLVPDLRISGFVLRGRQPPTEESEAKEVERGEGGFRFRFGGLPFVYDRLGLRLVES